MLRPPTRLAAAAFLLAAPLPSLTASPAPAGTPARLELRLARPSASVLFPAAPERSPGKAAARPALQRPNYSRAALEESLFLLGSQTSYWLKYAKFIEDWQFSLTWKDQSRRFFGLGAVRFDSNAYRLNWTHAFAGAIYYQFGRSNGLTWEGSLLMSTIGAFWWEYFVEWREVISINDLVFTSIGGYSNGEAWFRMAERLSESRSPVGRVFSWLNPIRKLNRLLDGSPPRPRAGEGEFEFRFDLGLRDQPVADGSRRTCLLAGFRGRSFDLRGPEAEGEARGVLKDTFFSEMSWTSIVLDGRFEELEFRTRVASWGRRTAWRGPGGYGEESFLGLASAFSYYQKHATEYYDGPHQPVREGPPIDFSEPRRFRDKLSAVHVAGPIWQWRRYGPGWSVRAIADAYLDFALVNALALNKWSETRSVVGIKTTMQYYGYYYGLGTTASAGVDAAWRSWRVEALGRWFAYASIQGRDRFQTDLVDDLPASDRGLRWSLRVGWRRPASGLELQGGFEHIGRSGRVPPLKVRSGEDRFTLGVGIYL